MSFVKADHLSDFQTGLLLSSSFNSVLFDLVQDMFSAEATTLKNQSSILIIGRQLEKKEKKMLRKIQFSKNLPFIKQFSDFFAEALLQYSQTVIDNNEAMTQIENKETKKEKF